MIAMAITKWDYIDGVDEEMQKQVVALLNLCKRHVFIQDDLTETFALGYHTETTAFWWMEVHRNA